MGATENEAFLTHPATAGQVLALHGTRRRALRFRYRQVLEIDELWLTDGRVGAPGQALAWGADNGSVKRAGQLVTIIAIRIARASFSWTVALP
ncbi:MAG: hypothetical protein WBN85_00845 [Candidatus Macondimonas sp.]